MKVALSITLFFAVTTAFCHDRNSATQLSVILGLGLPESIHSGIRISHKQWHFDASGGTTFGELFTVNGNVAYHFGSKKMIDRFKLKPWYTSFGISYLVAESTTSYSQDLYLNSRIGRDFRMTDRFNLSLSGGLGVNLYHERYDKDPGGWNFDIWLPIIPSGQFSLQFKMFAIKR